MKLVPLVLLAGYAALAMWGFTRTSLDYRTILALGPVGLVAFLFGYAIDLFIFGFLVKRTFGRRRKKARPSTL